MNKQIVLRKVKPGKLDKLRKWANVLESERLSEVVASLKAECVSREFAYVVELNNEYYCILYIDL